MPLIQYLLYFSVLVLVVGVTMKTIKIARMPIHIRWDLYPIPHEKGKEHYGGSYYEEIDWWTKPRDTSLFLEIKEMAREIFAIQSLYRNNRSLWYFSFPFHLGLYILIAFGGLLLINAILGAWNIPAGDLIRNLTVIAGGAGWILGAFGVLGLLLSRIFRGELRRYSTRSDYFNLILLAALLFSGLISWIAYDRSFSILSGFIFNMITFRTAGSLPISTLLLLYITAIFLVYLPFTRMTHFVGKYFAFHSVRWQDTPSRRGSEIEKAVIEELGHTQDWSAAHIKTGQTWAATASDEKKDPE